MARFAVLLSVCSFVCSPLWAIQPDLGPTSQASGLRPGWMAQRGEQTNQQTDEQMDGRTANLPILQDLVLYRGRCPTSAHENQENLNQN